MGYRPTAGGWGDSGAVGRAHLMRGQLQRQDRNKKQAADGEEGPGEFIFRFVQIHSGKPVSTIINLIFWHNVTFRIFGNPHTIRTLPSSFSD